MYFFILCERRFIDVSGDRGLSIHTAHPIHWIHRKGGATFAITAASTGVHMATFLLNNKPSCERRHSLQTTT